MTKKPLLNALAAALYIVLVASFMFYGSRMGDQKEDTVIIPIAMISLFTLSAAVMGYLFLYQPLQLYLDGEKKTGAKLFVQTVGTFAVITIILLFLLLLRNIF